MAMLANRVLQMAASETLAMNRKSKELQEQGLDIINLSLGEPDFDTPDFIKQKAKEAIDKGYSHYPPVPGYQDLRQAIVDKLKRDNGLNYNASQTVVSAGAKHAIINVLFAVINEGDEVIIPAPYWVSYPEMVKLVGGISVFVNAGIENDFKVTAEQIEQVITPKTKALMLNSPSNPTGSVYTKAELASIAAVLAKHPDVIVISDEIYELINFDGVHESIAQFPEIKDRVVIINGVSKGFAMTGWRIGYTVSNQVIADAINKIQGQMTSAASSIAQRATLAALQADPKKSEELQGMINTFKSRRNEVLRRLTEIPGMKVNQPTGAFYIFPDISSYLGKSFNGKTIATATDLAMYLLEEGHVALVGGDAFGAPNCIRISYAADTDSLIAACERIRTALALL